MPTISQFPDQSQTQIALVNFLNEILPAGVVVIEGQDNRLPEPEGVDFVVMTPILRERLSTTIQAWGDCKVQGSIAGTVMTVSAIDSGTIVLGTTVFGVGVTPGMTVLSQSSGPTGGVGDYVVSVAQTLSSQVLATGLLAFTQKTQLTFQLDFHSADVADSSDYAQQVSNLFRTEVAKDSFDASGFDVWPLYADNPRQTPFINAENQYETRWAVDAVVQANQTVDWPKQYMDNIVITIRPPVDG